MGHALTRGIGSPLRVVRFGSTLRSEVLFVLVREPGRVLVRLCRLLVGRSRPLVDGSTVLVGRGGVLADGGVAARVRGRFDVGIGERVLVFRFATFSLSRRPFLVASPGHATTVGPTGRSVHQ